MDATGATEGSIMAAIMNVHMLTKASRPKSMPPTIALAALA